MRYLFQSSKQYSMDILQANSLNSAYSDQSPFCQLLSFWAKRHLALDTKMPPNLKRYSQSDLAVYNKLDIY